MSFILDIIRGAVIGVANIIPGVSGGTMMVTMGIYDKLIGSITGIFKQFKKSIKTLLPYGIGMVVGIVAFAFLLKKVLIPKFPLPTAFAFIGLIVGGVPLLVKKTKASKKANLVPCVLLFALFFAMIIGMQFLGKGAAAVPPTATVYRTLEEVGKEFDVTRERIRQIEAKALRKLRHPSRSKKLKDFLS